MCGPVIALRLLTQVMCCSLCFMQTFSLVCGFISLWVLRFRQELERSVSQSSAVVRVMYAEHSWLLKSISKTKRSSCSVVWMPVNRNRLRVCATPSLKYQSSARHDHDLSAWTDDQSRLTGAFFACYFA